MIIESVALIIFVCSLGGVLLILARKIPALNSLPYTGTHEIKKHHIILSIENRIKEFLVAVEKQIFLHKLLSWVKIVILKAETKVDVLLHRIRKKAQQIDKQNKDVK